MIEYSDDQLSKLSQKQLIDVIKNATPNQKHDTVKKQKFLSKQQLFENVIKLLANKEDGYIKADQIVPELVKTNRFTELQARTYVRKACDFGYLYEPKPGHFKRA